MAKKKSPRIPVFIGVDELYPVYDYKTEDNQQGESAFLTQKEITFIDKACENWWLAQELLEKAYHGGKSREERVEEELRERSRREFELKKKGEKLRL